MKIENILSNISNPELVIDFTGLAQTKNICQEFTSEANNLIQGLPKGETIIIIDWAIPLVPESAHSISCVKDHINLTTLNPSLGKPHFYAVNNFYKRINNLENESILVGLNPGIKPSPEENQALILAGATHYSYSLVQAALFAAGNGLNGIGILINRDN